jgi:hypothetical protein
MASPRIGQIQNINDESNDLASSGFVVYGNDGRPAVTFGFLKPGGAVVAAKKMKEIIALCALVTRAS